jgi:hypothetical protein
LNATIAMRSLFWYASSKSERIAPLVADIRFSAPIDPDESTTKTIVVPNFFSRTFSRISAVEIASETPSLARLI